MNKEDSPSISKEDRSTPAQEWSVEEWWAVMTGPSRKRNLTPSQRRLLAKSLRLSRREYFAAKLEGTATGSTPLPESASVASPSTET
jgi:hypothetical protein